MGREGWAPPVGLGSVGSGWVGSGDVQAGLGRVVVREYATFGPKLA